MSQCRGMDGWMDGIYSFHFVLKCFYKIHPTLIVFCYMELKQDNILRNRYKEEQIVLHVGILVGIYSDRIMFALRCCY